MQPDQVPSQNDSKTTTTQQASESPGEEVSYRKSFKNIVLVSILFWGPALLIALAAFTVNYMFAWFLMPYGIGIPIYIAYVSGSLVSTFVDKHMKQAVWLALSLAILSTVCMVFDFRHKLTTAAAMSTEVTTNMYIMAGLTGILAIFIGVKAFKSVRWLAILPVILGAVSLIGLQIGTNRMNANWQEINLKFIQAEQRKKAQDQAEIDRATAAKNKEFNQQQDEKFAKLKSPFMIPPKDSYYTLGVESFSIDFEVNPVSHQQSLNKPFGKIDLYKNNDKVISLSSAPSQADNHIDTTTTMCRSISFIDYPSTCTYLMTTPGGIKVAKFKVAYAFEKNGSYQEALIKSSAGLNDSNIAEFVDSLVPGTADRIKIK